MIDVPLQAIANQSLSITLDGSRYELVIKEASGGMVCTCTKDAVVLVSNQRLVGDGPVLPYDYLRGGGGNIYIFTQDESVPWWEQFGVTQFMVYATADEIASA